MVRGLFNWTHRDIVRVLKEHGFVLNYSSGSHQFYIGNISGEDRQVCVPFHGKNIIKPRTVKSIMLQSGIPESDWKM